MSWWGWLLVALAFGLLVGGQFWLAVVSLQEFRHRLAEIGNHTSPGEEL